MIGEKQLKQIRANLCYVNESIEEKQRQQQKEIGKEAISLLKKIVYEEWLDDAETLIEEHGNAKEAKEVSKHSFKIREFLKKVSE